MTPIHERFSAFAWTNTLKWRRTATGLPASAASYPDRSRTRDARGSVAGAIALNGITGSTLAFAQQSALNAGTDVPFLDNNGHTVSDGHGGIVMVDSVSEVLKVPATVISPAPELSAEQTRLISRVANLDAQGRMILLIDPAQLLSQIEADMLARFDLAAGGGASKAS